jgi:hypothetical protein
MQAYFAQCAGWMAAPAELTLYEVSGLQVVVLS